MILRKPFCVVIIIGAKDLIEFLLCGYFLQYLKIRHAMHVILQSIKQQFRKTIVFKAYATRALTNVKQ